MKFLKFLFKILRKIIKFIFILIFILLIIGITITIYLGKKYQPEYENLKINAENTLEQISDTTFRRLDPTQIIKPNGEIVREFTPLKYEYLELDQIPTDVKQAFISIEDKNFYLHDGVDYKAILRAGLALIKNKGKITQGGSTITQQLVKITFLTNVKSYERKINEIFIAWELENKLGKNRILEYYINNIYFGNSAYGFETASNLYFNKTSSELSLAEITFLAAIPNNPTIYDPIKNKDNTIKRQRRILEQMFYDEKITYPAFKEAMKAEIELNIQPKEAYEPENFEVSYVLHSAIEVLMEKDGFEFKYGLNNDERKIYEKLYNTKYIEMNDKIREGGYTIVSSIETDKQELLQNKINDGLQRFTELTKDNLYKTQGAGVVIDNLTREIVAIVGGRTEVDQVNTFNRAYLGYRQPGSIMKPITAYGVEADIELLGFSIYEDTKDKKGPKNSSDNYRGKITAREALERSVNTIPFEIVKNRGPSLIHKYLHKMNFNKIVEEDLNAGIAIGGLTYGATPVEIAGAFSTLANNGKYIKPIGVKEIKFKDKVIFVNNKEEVNVYKEGTAFLITDMLKGVLEKPHGTAYSLKLPFPAAAKTGTTNGNKDGWLAGYTTRYTTVIWVGNDVPSKIDGLFGSTYPGKIWKNIMLELHKNMEVPDFQKPNSVKTVYVLNGKIYDKQMPGAIKEYVPSHLMDTIKVKNLNTNFNKEEQENNDETNTDNNDENYRKQLEKDFFDKYGITLETEEGKITMLENSIKTALSGGIETLSDLQEVIDKINDIGNEVKILTAPSSKEYIRGLIENAYVKAEDKFSKATQDNKNPLENTEETEKEEIPEIEEEELEVIDEIDTENNIENP